MTGAGALEVVDLLDLVVDVGDQQCDRAAECFASPGAAEDLGMVRLEALASALRGELDGTDVARQGPGKTIDPVDRKKILAGVWRLLDDPQGSLYLRVDYGYTNSRGRLPVELEGLIDRRGLGSLVPVKLGHTAALAGELAALELGLVPEVDESFAVDPD